MSINLNLQITEKFKQLPSKPNFNKWVNAALAHTRRKNYEITIRIVGDKESAQLNEQYRHKKGPTNVLSFPYHVPLGAKSLLLGDLIICAPVVATEASAQNKKPISHWAHLVIHGTLHLLGYDHIKKADALKMEKLEIQIMEKLGYANPYEIMD